jgi:serine/threonine protein kinase
MDGRFLTVVVHSFARRYLAPEILIESGGGALAPKGYDKAVDLWSLGCILYIMSVASCKRRVERDLLLLRARTNVCMRSCHVSCSV